MSFLALAGFLPILAASFLGGRCLLGSYAERLNPLSRLAFSGGLGLAALAYWVFLVGILRLLYAPILLAGVFGLATLGTRQVRAVVGDLRAAFGRPRGVAGWAIAVALTICLVWPLSNALRPPHEWDSLSYHLPIPKQYLEHRGIHYIEYDHHSNFPMTMDMLFLLGLGLGSDRLPALFHLATHVLCLLAIAGLCVSESPTPSAPVRPRTLKSSKPTIAPSHRPALAALIFASVPAVGWEAGTAYIDIGLALYVVLAATALYRWWEDPQDKTAAALAGVAVGVALGIKQTGVIALLIATACLVVKMMVRRKVFFRVVAWLYIPAILVGGPWYLRSYLYTGNPVYPFFFGGRGWPRAGAQHYRAEHRSHGLDYLAEGVRLGSYEPTRLTLPEAAREASETSPGNRPLGRPTSRSGPRGEQSLHARVTKAIFAHGVPPPPVNWLLAPYYITMDPRGFWEARSVYSVMSPIYLAVLPLLLFLRPVPVSAKLTLAAGIFWLITWTHLSQLLRYLFPALALTTPAAACAADLAIRRPRVARLTTALVVAGLAVPLYICSLMLVVSLASPWEEEAFIEQNLESYPVMKWANQNLPAGSKIATYGETRCYYLKVPYFWADPIHNLIIDYDSLRTSRGLLNAYRKAGVTHILVNYRWPAEKAAGATERLVRLLSGIDREGRLVPVQSCAHGMVVLFELQYPAEGAAE